MVVRKRTPRRRVVVGLTRAVREYFITGHWWGFLCEDGESRPGVEELTRIWGAHREKILGKYPDAWAGRTHGGPIRQGQTTDLPLPPLGSVEQVTEAWVKTVGDRRAVENGCWFDWEAGDRVRAFFERFLVHSKGEWAGEPFVLMDWMRDDIVMPLFGWKRPDGKRRFKLAYIGVPKKNAKSFFGSGAGLYMLVGDDERGPEVYAAACDRDQARIVFDESEKMVEASPILNEVLKITNSKHRIDHKRSKGLFRCLSAENYKSEGLNISFLIFDELHVQKTRDMWDTLRYGGALRGQPFTIAITTAGWDTASICYQQYDYAKRVLSGALYDDSFFAYIREAEREDDWTDPKVWYQANPALGEIMSEESFRDDCIEAQNTPAQVNTFKRYRLNIWTRTESSWIELAVWDKCGGEIDIDKLEGEVCYGGLDLSSTQDVTALSLAFPREGGFVELYSFFWVPRRNAEERSARDRLKYLEWADGGYVTLTQGDFVDQEEVRRFINELGRRFRINEIAVDLWNSAKIRTDLESDGFEMLEYSSKSVHMTAAVKEMERLVIAELLKHGSNPVLRWMLDNVVIVEDSEGRYRPSKKKSREKIDGIISGLYAVDRNARNAGDVCMWGERGITVLEG